MKFEKPALDIDEKIKLLKERGLIFEDEDSAKHSIEHIWYFRLSGYCKFFQDKDTNIFFDWVRFQEILDLYVFDRKLRLLTLDAIEKIEISFKANMIDILSKEFWVFWYLNTELFFLKSEKFQKNYDDFIKIVEEKQEYSSSLFVKDYFKKYDEKYLPSWMLFEDLTIGEVFNIYYMLDKTVQQKIANKYDVNFQDLVNRNQLIRNVRNIAAHHGRLWNRKLIIRLTNRDEKLWWLLQKDTARNKVIPNYFNWTLVIHYLLKHINKDFSWIQDLSDLFDDFPWIPKEKMWFDENWQQKIEA